MECRRGASKRKRSSGRLVPVQVVLASKSRRHAKIGDDQKKNKNENKKQK